MAEKNLVNETLLQIQNLEEVINENAKEILESTMKQEISELVKESLKDHMYTSQDIIGNLKVLQVHYRLNLLHILNRLCKDFTFTILN